jgi:hypothetical protein
VLVLEYVLCCSVIDAFYTTLIELRWAFPKIKTNRLCVSLPFPEDGKRSSFRNVVFSSYLEFLAIDEVHKLSDSESESSEPFGYFTRAHISLNSRDHFFFWFLCTSQYWSTIRSLSVHRIQSETWHSHAIEELSNMSSRPCVIGNQICVKTYLICYGFQVAMSVAEAFRCQAYSFPGGCARQAHHIFLRAEKETIASQW